MVSLNWNIGNVPPCVHHHEPSLPQLWLLSLTQVMFECLLTAKRFSVQVDPTSVPLNRGVDVAAAPVVPLRVPDLMVENLHRPRPSHCLESFGDFPVVNLGTQRETMNVWSTINTTDLLYNVGLVKLLRSETGCMLNKLEGVPVHP